MNSATARAEQTTNGRIKVRHPYDGAIVGEVEVTTPGALEESVRRARAASDDFRSSTPAERRALLVALAEAVRDDHASLAETICGEMGKTIVEARNEARRAVNTLSLSGDAATFVDGEVLHCGIVPGGADRQATVTYVPVGVVGAITPFNYPLNLLCHKLGPAIAAGNAVVAKPSPKAPLAAARLEELARRAGFPDGLFQVVQGGADVAQALAASRIDLLSFTGGPEAGLALKRASGLVPTLMELGGNDPLIVMPDADIDAAVATAIAQRFEIAGQSCAAVKKLYLHEDIRTAFIDRLLAAVESMNTGDPHYESTDMGPVIDEAAAETVSRRIASALHDGGELLAGGGRNGTLIEPTVIDNVSLSSDLIATETFGPVISIRSFTSLDNVIDELNKSRYGLQAGIYSNDHAAIRNLAKRLQVGGLMVNEGPDFRAEHVPFGGIKTSGIGREGVRITIREMSELRVLID
ncbi:MAG: aldehyde dehydrogenase family protein [Planctomycetes bacterium]|jgi:acyl-CoA reductase-like NAD-dependent aldehyde dehydrogenase|nr:aldehyde dehydrogenase family protein [Planctomycetota bacterium]